MIPIDLVAFFGMLFAALNVMEKTNAREWKIFRRKE